MEAITKLVESLAPRDQRYDTPIADDLVLCTFPNAMKTWVFIHNGHGYQRRRSLGIYPAMTVADALHALHAARKLQNVEEELSAQGLGAELDPDETAIRRAGLVPELRLRPGGLRNVHAGLAGALLATTALLCLQKLDVDFVSRILAQPRLTQASAPGLALLPPDPPRPMDAAPPPAAAASVAASAKPSLPSARRPTELSPANRALLQAQRRLRGSVAREVLARGVEGGHPTDPFEGQLSLSGPAPVYYFTELRGMAGANITHEWMHAGKQVAQVELSVGEGWRSTLYSSTTVAPGMTGTWQVIVRDASGKLLEQESFEIQATAQLTSR